MLRSWTPRTSGRHALGLAVVLLIEFLFWLPGPVHAGDDAASLHERIDAIIERSHLGPVAPLASDTDFVRRIYLDLAGRIPSSDETRAFLQDEAPDKRARLIDHLLASDDFTRHMALSLDLMLMERRADTHVPAEEWHEYLRRSVAENKPLDQLAREILRADGSDKTPPAAAKFYLDRLGEPHVLTRDVSRIFFGRDVECAQCHDHPLIGDYLQAEYYGLFAFLDRSFLFLDEQNDKKPYFAERAEGETVYASVFDPDAEKTTALPQLPEGLPLDEPPLSEDEAYLVKPDKEKKVRPVPRFSRREQLALQATSAESRMFNRNLANRLWAHLLGRGLVDPVDLHHADNPPSHPELLELLAEALVERQFDLRQFLRQIALSRTYQRSIDPPELPRSWSERLTAARDHLSTLAEQRALLMQRAEASAESLSRARERRTAARQQFQQAEQAQQQAETVLVKARAAVAQATQAWQETRTQQRQQEELLASVQQAVTAAQQAAEQAGDDPPLKEAAALLAQRLDTLTQQVKAHKATLAEQKEAQQQAQTAQEAAETQLAQRIDQTQACRQELAQRTGAMMALGARHDTDQRAVLHLEQQIKAGKVWLHYLEQRQRQDDLTGQVARLEQQIAGLTPQVAAAAEMAEQLEQKELQARQARDDAQQEGQQQQSALAQHQAAHTSLQEAVEKTAAAVAALPQDTDLARTQQNLQAQLQQLTTQIAEQTAQVQQAEEKIEQTERQWQAAQAAHQEGRAEQDRLAQKLTPLQQELDRTQTELQSVTAALAASPERFAQLWTRRFVMASLKPLTPEQLAHSFLQATGLNQRLRLEAERHWQDQQKDQADKQIDPAQREAEITQLHRERQQKVVQRFVQLFAPAAGQPQNLFHATVDQALFLANDGEMRNWLAPAEGSLVRRVIQLPTAVEQADELYLSILNRPPSPAEAEEVIAHLAARHEDPEAAVQEWIWGLVTSLEFRFNH